jgi:hypothetical protein
MPLSILFWVIYVVAVIFSLWTSYEPGVPTWRYRAGGYVVTWILIGILGYRVFGAVVR